MTDNGGCDTCGASYTDADFGTEDGYLILNHVCDHRAIARRNERFPRYMPETALANLAKARSRKCVDCGRPPTKESERCRYHQRQNWIRKATIAANGRLVRPEEAA